MAWLNGEKIKDDDGNTIYPHIVKQQMGYKVNVSKGRSLPGVFTSYFMAERALEKDQAKLREMKKKRNGTE